MNYIEMLKPKKLKTGGSVLLEKHGPGYFSKLRKDGWLKQKKAAKLWEKTHGKDK